MIYDYQCKCGKIANKLFSFKANIQVFRPYLDLHIADNPVLIESKRQKNQLLKEADLVEL